jgi:hypothetical protein
MSEDKSREKNSEKSPERDISDYLSEEERRRLLSSLHRVLVWVGVKDPEVCRIERGALKREMEKFHQTEMDLPPEVDIDKCIIDLHHLIWRLINESEITDQERVQIEEIIDLLEKKEKAEEEVLLHERLTHSQAKQIYNEAAGVLRSIIDLKDILKKREHTAEDRDRIKARVEDARRWNDFMDKVKEVDA